MVEFTEKAKKFGDISHSILKRAFLNYDFLQFLISFSQELFHVSIRV